MKLHLLSIGAALLALSSCAEVTPPAVNLRLPVDTEGKASKAHGSEKREERRSEHRELRLQREEKHEQQKKTRQLKHNAEHRQLKQKQGHHQLLSAHRLSVKKRTPKLVRGRALSEEATPFEKVYSGQGLLSILPGGGLVGADGALPAPGNVLDLLGVGRLMNNQISFGLQNLITIFDNLPLIGDLEGALFPGITAQGVPSESQETGQDFPGLKALSLGRLLSSVTNLASGLPSLTSSLLPTLSLGSSLGRARGGRSGPFSYFSRLPFRGLPTVGGGVAGGQGVAKDKGESEKLVDGPVDQRTLFKEALNQSLALNADLDALTTLFSSGHQIPLVSTLLHLNNASSSLAAHPNGLTEWIGFQGALNQLSNDVSSLKVAYNLTAAQDETVSDVMDAISQLNGAIETHSGDIDSDLIKRVSAGLDALGNSVLKFNGTTLTPKLTVGGQSLDNRIPDWDRHAGYHLDFDGMPFLHEGFGFTGSALLGLVTLPLDVGGKVATDFYNLASRVRLTDFISWGLGGVPSLLSQTLHLTRIFDYLTATMGHSLDVAHGFSADTNSTLKGVLSDQMASSKGGMSGLAKILYIESGKQHLEKLQGILKKEKELLASGAPAAQRRLEGSATPSQTNKDSASVDKDFTAQLEAVATNLSGTTQQMATDLYKRCHLGPVDNENVTAIRAALMVSDAASIFNAVTDQVLDGLPLNLTPAVLLDEMTHDIDPVDLSDPTVEVAAGIIDEEDPLCFRRVSGLDDLENQVLDPLQQTLSSIADLIYSVTGDTLFRLDDASTSTSTPSTTNPHETTSEKSASVSSAASTGVESGSKSLRTDEAPDAKLVPPPASEV